MARSVDHFRQSDVTFWGIAAICCGGIALLSITLSALVPPSVLAGLHASRLDGATLNQLRSQVASLETATVALKGENNALLTRFTLAESRGTDVAQRVGAIEVALPNMVEENGGALIDRNAVTASIGQPTEPVEADSGSVAIQQAPLIPAQPMPAVVANLPRMDGDAYGVALGAKVDAYGASTLWTTINAKVGTLMIGLTPVLADEASGTGKYLVAGPLPGFAQARDLCARLAPVGIPCRPVPFVGTPLAP